MTPPPRRAGAQGDPITLSAGTRLGPYEILSPLGAGGMGEVYRARDKKVSRDVTIKVLPADLDRDQRALTRFEREARAIPVVSPTVPRPSPRAAPRSIA